MAIFFGIDAGSSYVKAAALDLERGKLRHIYRAATPEFLPGFPEGHRESDPLAIFEAVETVLDRLHRAERRCDGVLLCGQMQGFVLVDAAGEPVSNYISWQDERVTPEEFADLNARVTAEERDDLGNDWKPGIALPILHWLRQRGQLPAGATPISIADFVAARLCGATPILDPTQAAAFGALSLATLDWRHDVLARLGLDSLQWPHVRPSGTIAGTWRRVPCYASFGDQQCSIAGALLQGVELSVNIGTGAQVSCIVASRDPEGCQVRPYFDGRFLRTITHIPGGRALRPLVALLSEFGGTSEEVAWQHIESEVARVPSTDVRATVTFFPGPCGNRGSLENLHDRNMTIGHLFRAVFESMALNFADCARRLGPGAAAGSVVFSGGVARRLPVLRDLTAAALGMPQRLSPHSEDTLHGLLVLAMALAIGRR